MFPRIEIVDMRGDVVYREPIQPDLQELVSGMVPSDDPPVCDSGVVIVVVAAVTCIVFLLHWVFS